MAARKRTVLSAIKLSVLVLLSSFLLTSCGAATSSLPICPSYDVTEYLKCALGSSGDKIEEKSESLSAYCEEEAGEWLPVLDKNVRSSLPSVRIYLQDLIALGKARPEDLNNLTLYQNVVSIYILDPTKKGVAGSTGSCIDDFEAMRASGLIRFLRAEED